MSHWRPSIRLQAPLWHGILPDTFKTARPPAYLACHSHSINGDWNFTVVLHPALPVVPRAARTHYRQSIHKPMYKWTSDAVWGLLQCLQTLTFFHRRWNTFCLFCQYSSGIPGSLWVFSHSVVTLELHLFPQKTRRETGGARLLRAMPAHRIFLK